MRNNRGALWALGLAGAAYLWRNRGRLQQQLGQLNRSYRRQSLPDFGSSSGQGQQSQGWGQQDQGWEQPRQRQFGGTDV